MTLLASLAATLVTPAQALPPPVIAVPGAPPRGESMLVEFAPGEVRCGSATEVPVRQVVPDPAAAYVAPVSSQPNYTITFDIDEIGRPVDIANPVRSKGEGAFVGVSDLAPALSLWRFAPGRRRQRCSIAFAIQPTPFASAPMDSVFRFLSIARSGQGGREPALARVRALDCTKPALPRLSLRAYPDYTTIEQPPGTTAHSVVRFDIDDQGVPRNARTQSSGGNRALDEQAIDAVGRSRYASGDPRTGCIMPFLKWTREAIPAPPAPDPEDFRPANATCGKVEWQQMPRLAFPGGFERRSIEGWAILRFDLAPWGAPGNVEIVASEPAQAFGQQGKGIVMQARSVASQSGATGCVERVFFRIAQPGNSPVG